MGIQQGFMTTIVTKAKREMKRFSNMSHPNQHIWWIHSSDLPVSYVCVSMPLSGSLTLIDYYILVQQT